MARELTVIVPPMYKGAVVGIPAHVPVEVTKSTITLPASKTY